MRRIYIGSDHAGYSNKKYVEEVLQELNIPYEDLTPELVPGDDYPDVAKKVCKKVISNSSKGILLCGTGIGISIAANKIKGIRAALVNDSKLAELAKAHNNANVLVIPGNLVKSKIKPIILSYFEAKFSRAKRHIRRISKLK